MNAVLPPLHAAELPTPAGELAVVVSPDDGAVRASGFCRLENLVARLPADLLERGVVPQDDLGAVGRAVQRYADGELLALDDVPVVQPGGPFFQVVWQRMREIAPG